MTERSPEEVLESVLPVSATVEATLGVDAEQVWPLISDPSVNARFSGELRAANFVDGDVARIGAVIEGRNENNGFQWTTQSTVVACEPPTTFAWATGDPTLPYARWTFDFNPATRRLRHSVSLEAGESPLRWAILNDPDRANEVVATRLAQLTEGMQRTVDGIATLAGDAAK
jgi:Polyketide cyclase / dehydrase and lipid transport